MNVKETQYQLDEIMKINNAKFLTSNQFNWLRSNITNKIERISKERETLIQNQSVPFNERILKLQAMDKEMESQKESLKFLENQKNQIIYSPGSSTQNENMNRILQREQMNDVELKQSLQKITEITPQGINKLKMNNSTKTDMYSKTQHELENKSTDPNMHKSQNKIGVRRDVNATFEYSLNNSGFTNYKPEEAAYYKNKFPDQNSQKGNENLKSKEEVKMVKLSKVEESQAESASNIKFVDYSGFEGELRIQEDCIVEPRKTYNKRYGKTIIKESNILTNTDLDMEIKKSVVQTINQDSFISEDRKNLCGTYVKKHYRKLGGVSKKRTPNKKIQTVVTREVNIEDLPNVSKLDITFDHLGESRVKTKIVYDAEGNVIEQDDQVLSSVFMSKSQAQTYRDMNIQDNLKMVRKVKKSSNDLQVVDCYQESQVFQKKNNEDHSLQDCYEGVYFSECKIAEDYKNAILEMYLNDQSKISEADVNVFKNEYLRELSKIMSDQREFIESNQEEIIENVNREIIQKESMKQYFSEGLKKDNTQATNLTFGKYNTINDERSERMINIVRFATQTKDSEKMKTDNSLKNNLISMNTVENGNNENQLKIEKERARQYSMYIRDQLRDAPQIKLHHGSEELQNKIETLTQQSKSYAHSREKSLVDSQTKNKLKQGLSGEQKEFNVMETKTNEQGDDNGNENEDVELVSYYESRKDKTERDEDSQFVEGQKSEFGKDNRNQTIEYEEEVENRQEMRMETKETNRNTIHVIEEESNRNIDKLNDTENEESRRKIFQTEEVQEVKEEREEVQPEDESVKENVEEGQEEEVEINMNQNTESNQMETQPETEKMNQSSSQREGEEQLVRIYTETSYNPTHQITTKESKPILEPIQDQVSERNTVTSSGNIVRYTSPTIKRKSNVKYHTMDERIQNRRYDNHTGLNKSYTNARNVYRGTEIMNRSQNSNLLDQSIRSTNPRIQYQAGPNNQVTFKNNNFGTELSENINQRNESYNSGTRRMETENRILENMETNEQVIYNDRSFHTQSGKVGSNTGEKNYSKKNIEPYSHHDKDASYYTGYTQNESYNPGQLVDEYYGQMMENTLQVTPLDELQGGDFVKKELYETNKSDYSQNKTLSNVGTGKQSGNEMANRSNLSGGYSSNVRGSYSRQIDGEVRNSSSIVKETVKVKLIKTSVNENPVSTREVSRNVYEQIQEGEPKERKSNSVRRSMNITKEVPKIVEKIVEVPYTVTVEKPVPNYIYKDVVTEVVIETKTDRIIENDIEETVEREVENVTEQEKITEVVQEVEHVKEKQVFVESKAKTKEQEMVQEQEGEMEEKKETIDQNVGTREKVEPDQLVEFDEEMLDKVSVKEENGVEYRTYYVKVNKDVIVDVDDIQYKDVEVERTKNVEVERVVYKDIEKEEVKVVEVEEEEIIIEKKDKVVDVYKDSEEVIRKVVKVPRVKKLQIFKDVEVEKEIVEEVPVEIYRDKEVIKVREVEVPRTVEVAKEVQMDVYENTEKPEYIQKVIETEREFEVNITKMKPKYKEVPINRYEDVEVNVNEYKPVEEIYTVNKKKDVIVPKIVEKIVQVPRIIEKKVEREVEQIKIVTVPVYRDVIVEKKIPVIVEKKVEVPYKKYVEKKIYKEIEKPVEIEVIEENPIIVENEVEETINHNVMADSMRENLMLKNQEKIKLQNEAYELKRELRKSQQRKSERRKSNKKYKYLGKEENRHLRKELTQLHREYRNVIQKNTYKQINEMQNSEVVRVIDRKKMDSGTILELKKSGIIKEGEGRTIPETSGIRYNNQQNSQMRKMNSENERIMNETIRTYQTIGSNSQLNPTVTEIKNSSMQRIDTGNMMKMSKALNQQPTNPQSINSQVTQRSSTRPNAQVNMTPNRQMQSNHYSKPTSRQVLESGNVSRTSTKRSIKLGSYKSKDMSTLNREKSQKKYGRAITQPASLMNTSIQGGSEKYYGRNYTVAQQKSVYKK